MLGTSVSGDASETPCLLFGKREKFLFATHVCCVYICVCVVCVCVCCVCVCGNTIFLQQQVCVYVRKSVCQFETE